MKKELLVIIYALEKFWAYLVGAKVIVYTIMPLFDTYFWKRMPSQNLLDGCFYYKSLSWKFETKSVENKAVDHLSRLEGIDEIDDKKLPIDEYFSHEKWKITGGYNNSNAMVWRCG